MDERDDYADPKPPRTLASKLLLTALILMVVGSVATAAWFGFLMLCGSCTKYG
jgi:hypothetical protein